jgi:NaMN:DMB phosphoribosyltransferase
VQPTADQPTSTLTGPDIDIRPGLILPLPDDAAAAAARDRLSTVDIGVNAPTLAALGMLAEAVVFMAAVQCTPYPRPVLSTRVVLLTGSHSGGVVAGPAPDPRNATPLQHLAINAGAGIVTLEWQPAAAAIELEDAVTTDQMDASLRAGWAEADRAADEGIELLVLAAGGAGSSVAAAAVVAAITGAEPTMLLTRVVTPAGYYDDNAWMTRCLALRDALHRVRDRDGDPRTVLAALGGADIAAATGLILGAASRRTPIMIDGPVGAAAALLANDFSPQSRSWIVLPDTGRHPAVRLATDSLQLRPWLDLCLDLGEGAASLSALPLMQTALTLAGAGEQVEPQPLTRLDSTGNQVFVGVAKPVDGGEDEAAEEEVFTGSTMETAPVTYASAHAVGDAVAATPAGSPVPEPAAVVPPVAAAAEAAKPPAKPTKPEAKAPEPKAAETKSVPDRKPGADRPPAGAPGADAQSPKVGADAGGQKPAVTVAKPADAGPRPAEPGPKPAEPGAKPAAPGPRPAAPAAKPTDAAAKATEPTQKPADTTPKPAETAVKPAEPTPKPADTTPKPAETAAKPAEPGSKPAEPGQKPGVKPPTRTAIKPPAKAPASKALTGRTAASKAVPAKAAPAKDSPSKESPAKDGATQGTQAQGGNEAAADATGPVPAKDVPAKDAAAKPAPAKTAPAKDIPARDVPAKDGAASNGSASDVREASPAAKDGKSSAGDDRAAAGVTPADDRAASADVEGEPTAVVAASGAPTPPRPRKRP